jgi:hypothetical protein
VIDTSDLEVEGVVDQIEALVRDRFTRSGSDARVDKSFPTDAKQSSAT